MNAFLEGVSLIKNTGTLDLIQNNKTITLSQPFSGESTSSSESSVTAMVAFTSPAYFGGVPDSVKLPAGVGKRTLRACVATIDKIDFGDETLYEAESMGYAPEQCPVETIACAKFDGSGHVLMHEVGLLKGNNTFVSIYPTNDTGIVLFEGSEVSVTSGVVVGHVTYAGLCYCAVDCD